MVLNYSYELNAHSCVYFCKFFVFQRQTLVSPAVDIALCKISDTIFFPPLSLAVGRAQILLL